MEGVDPRVREARIAITLERLAAERAQAERERLRAERQRMRADAQLRKAQRREKIAEMVRCHAEARPQYRQLFADVLREALERTPDRALLDEGPLAHVAVEVALRAARSTVAAGAAQDERRAWRAGRITTVDDYWRTALAQKGYHAHAIWQVIAAVRRALEALDDAALAGENWPKYVGAAAVHQVLGLPVPHRPMVFDNVGGHLLRPGE